jgi:hypothetical protein
MNAPKDGEMSVTVAFNMVDIIAEILRASGPKDALDIYQRIKVVCDQKVQAEIAKVKAKLPPFALPLFTEARASGSLDKFSYDTVVMILTQMEQSGRVRSRQRSNNDPEYFFVS